MGALDKIFRGLLENAATKKVVLELFTRQIAKQGIVLSNQQHSKIKSQLDALDWKNTQKILTVDLDVLDSKSKLPKVVKIDLTDCPDLDQITQETVDEMISASLKDAVAETSNSVLSSLKFDAPRMRGEHKSLREGFEVRLTQRWGGALDLLEMLIVITEEAGRIFNAEFRPGAAQTNNLVFDAVVRLHARGCQVASEVLLLLRGGFADGAHARWRTLHEISVVASFIRQSGRDVAERYLLHQHIEARKAAVQYQDNLLDLDLTPISEADLADIEANYASLVARFGDAYKKDYGWAAGVFGTTAPNFSEIEREINLEYMRPYYRLASHNVHANPKGILYKLGQPPGGNFLLSGPSSVGLADPGQNTASTLYFLTATLIAAEPDVDGLVAYEVVRKLAIETSEAFVLAHSSTPS